MSGTGTAILSDVVIPFAPSRVKLTSEGSCTAKLTGGAYDYVFDGDSYEEKFFDQSGTFNLLVETAGAWSFVVEPIMDGGTLPLSGTGPFVSDFVELPAPMIVTVEGNKGSMNALLTNFIVKLNHQYKNLDAWNGAQLHHDTPSKWFRRFADAHGFEGVRFHDLRHTHATILLANNIDAVAVATRMGHADASVTLRIYAHALRRRDEDAAKAAQGLLDRAQLGEELGDKKE